MKEKEQALLALYLWEQRYRGFERYSYPVTIEVPYFSFRHDEIYDSINYIDRKTPNIWKRIANKFQKGESSFKIDYPDPKTAKIREDLCVIQIKFPKTADIPTSVSKELISSLARTSSPVSFEIIGTGEEIQIQITCAPDDESWTTSHMMMYFPEVQIKKIEQFDLPFHIEKTEIALIDFGLKKESMTPIALADNFDIDPLVSFFAVLESLPSNSSCLLQVIFKGADSPLAKDILYSVRNGNFQAFFNDFTEIATETKIKLESPLVFSSIRLVVQGKNQAQTHSFSHQAISSLSAINLGNNNHLTPISNEGYDYQQHLMNVFYRTSNRHGMLLSINELLTLVHYPNKEVISPKLTGIEERTKPVSFANIDKPYSIGINRHNTIHTPVSLDDETRLKHLHILGTTGVGKSTFLANMFLDDAKHGNGCALFDPHGDIVEDILMRIPEHRKDDVILINPSDIEYPIGFNLLNAKTETEKLGLTADLVSAICKHSTAADDTTLSILSNAIDTFLNSDSSGTLLEMKRFLIDDSFRKKFLHTVSDSSLHYYWNNEYELVKHEISPILTRIDKFLRPKVIRLMMAQKEGIDFRRAIEEKKIILFKLSLGLIGEENAYLLASLFLSKMNQAILGRQALHKSERHPYYLYLDECQHFMSPSIGTMLSGGRKYGVGITLSHQSLSQIEHLPTQNAILSNPSTKICFRLGHQDAKIIEQELSYFNASDLTNLNPGEAIVRLGNSENDCNITTQKLNDPVDLKIKNQIIENVRLTYAKNRFEVERDIDTLLTQKENVRFPQKEIFRIQKIPKEENTEYLSQNEQLTLRRKIQIKIKKLGQEYGFTSSIQYRIHNGKNIDVSLVRGSLRIACQIYVAKSINEKINEMINCFEAGYLMVLLISEDQSQLNNIKLKAQEKMDERDFKRTKFIFEKMIPSILKATLPKEKKTDFIQGFKTNTDQDSMQEDTDDQLRKDIERIIRKKS